jgi:hypothetical protein
VLYVFPRGRSTVNVGWLLVGGVAFAISLLVTFALMKVASESDRVARRTEKALSPYSDVTVTQGL